MKCHCNRRRRTPRYLHNENSNHLQMSPQHIGVWYHTLKIFKHKKIMFIIERHFPWKPMHLPPKNNNEERKNLVSMNHQVSGCEQRHAIISLFPLFKAFKATLAPNSASLKNRERINLQHHKKFQLRFINFTKHLQLVLLLCLKSSRV